MLIKILIQVYELAAEGCRSFEGIQKSNKRLLIIPFNYALKPVILIPLIHKIIGAEKGHALPPRQIMA